MVTILPTPSAALIGAEYWDRYWSRLTLPREYRHTPRAHYLNAILDVFDRWLPADATLTAAEIGGAPGQYLAYVHRALGYRRHLRGLLRHRMREDRRQLPAARHRRRRHRGGHHDRRRRPSRLRRRVLARSHRALRRSTSDRREPRAARPAGRVPGPRRSQLPRPDRLVHANARAAHLRDPRDRRDGPRRLARVRGGAPAARALEGLRRRVRAERLRPPRGHAPENARSLPAGTRR